MTNILEVPMQENDADAKTIGDYFRSLLATLWAEYDCFSGKRPFGNSGWKYDLYHALVRAKVVQGCIDEDGDLADFDEDAADALIEKSIASFGKAA